MFDAINNALLPLTTHVGYMSLITIGAAYWYYRRKFIKSKSSKMFDESVDCAPLRTSMDNKLLLVVRTDLKMGKGKVAAQCCHAAVAAYEAASRKSPQLLKSWKQIGQPKIVVKIDDEEEMLKLADEARQRGLLVNLVRDAGRTQIAPGSKTVVAIGPGPTKLIDDVTGHLKLY